ncbi:MAG: hypothetical protein A3F54_02140 [Candidatus Kerfeldbacteria bacterium RIFCSPHIGHO2_12_FULL_48_17]|uniref:Uncharacterized protein n=1 Tax=Candidatus Kerfeldbacteria bacterium RIFCSPHIGHO2_12_FULL_48_17 TaxID=1798542 RepID=A0A1G2AWY5_9BACT|nr:MAG: hypothetical protein A3F54_02140 [Candidatus Kerfeldbacteria bacterium RIFCSPHIGHO2_12_FULL_48_17]
MGIFISEQQKQQSGEYFTNSFMVEILCRLPGVRKGLGTSAEKLQQFQLNFGVIIVIQRIMR